MTQENYEFRVGSKYAFVYSGSDDITVTGIFEGYIMIGSESALVVRMDGDRIRYIPVSKIVCIDLIESVAEAAPKAKAPPERLYG